MKLLNAVTVFGSEESGKQQVKNIINSLPNAGTSDTTAAQNNIVNTVLFYLGIIAVIVVIFGGAKLAMSAGNPVAVTKAKQTIVFALIGLAVVLLAYAIVNFVIEKLF